MVLCLFIFALCLMPYALCLLSFVFVLSFLYRNHKFQRLMPRFSMLENAFEKTNGFKSYVIRTLYFWKYFFAEKTCFFELMY